MDVSEVDEFYTKMDGLAFASFLSSRKEVKA
jgi:hypothetical protein